jgi:glycosyltransferase involved in cell wall biosynthesis
MTGIVGRPRVGVAVRTKNRPWFLARALRDIDSQVRPADEIHIVNDGGDAAAVEHVVASMSDRLRDRIRVSHNHQPVGRSAAANQAIRALSSDFVVLHDDDDLWHESFLSTTVDWLEHHPDDVGVMVPTEIVYEVARDGGYREVGRAPFWPSLDAITYLDLLQVNRAVPISYLYRRSLHDDVGWYREDLHAAEDWEFNLRTTLRHHIGFTGGQPLAYWMQRRGVEGEAGNSMYALASEHSRYDTLVRDEALRAFVQQFGPGLPLYLAKFVQDEVARQLDERRSIGQRLTGMARRWWRDRRTR